MEDHRDLNQPLFHHQVALIRANADAQSTGGLVEHDTRKIHDLRGQMGLSPLTGWAEAGTHAR
jgi:hypothetical protein